MSCAEIERPDFEKGNLLINSNKFNIEIAKNQEQRSFGLMFLKDIPYDYGMLFSFEQEMNIVMWMKNTYVSLDMVFINENGIINYIEKNTKPLSLDRIASSHLSKYVLELKSGATDKFKIKVGDKVNFLKN